MKKHNDSLATEINLVACIAIIFSLLLIFAPKSAIADVPYTELRNGAGVFVFPPTSSTSGIGTVLLPDGTNLDVSSSQTAGIQEAIDYARDYGWDIFIYGRGSYSTHGVYHLNRGLRFDALQGKTIRIVDATLDFGNLSNVAAITFDSTMMVDFRMTGSLLATSAPQAVLFKPVTPHPLDGVLYGAKGVVASRFHFDTIKGGQRGVFFDTSVADVNNNSFYFGNIVVATAGTRISQTGGRFSQNFRDWEDQSKAGLPIRQDSLDYFRPQGVVVLPPEGPIGNPGTVLLPDGTKLNTTGTQTSGIQEAVNYAVQNNLDIAIYGRGLQTKFITFSGGQPSYPNNGFYQISQGLVFPPINNKTIRIYNVTFNYGATGVDSAITFKGADSVDFELTGQVVSVNVPTGIRFYPSSTQPIVNSRFRIGSVGPGENIGALFDMSIGSITNNRFLFNEILKANYNLLISPPKTDKSFSSNYVRALTAHEINRVGLQIGQNTTNAGNIRDNQFVVFLDADNSNPDVGVQVWGKNNKIFASLRGSTGVRTARGVSFETSSTGNSLTYSELNATVPIFQSVVGANTYRQSSSDLFTGNDVAPSPTPTPIPTTLNVSLTANPTSGTAPLTSVLTATVGGTAIGNINYSFWWNCSYTGTDIAQTTSQCGTFVPPTPGSCIGTPGVGLKCDSITTNPYDWTTVYPGGSWTSKVIVERGGATPAEARIAIMAGSPTPTPTPTVMPTPPSPSQTPAPTPTPSPAPSISPTPSPSKIYPSLIRFGNDPRVYVFVDNKIKWIPDLNIFNFLGYRWDLVKVLPLSSKSLYKRASLLRTENGSKVYYITEGGLKRHIPNIEVFDSYANRWQDVIIVKDFELAAIPDNQLIKFGGDARVYKLENSQKRWIKTAETFNRLGLNWNQISPVNSTEINAFPDGQDIE